MEENKFQYITPLGRNNTLIGYSYLRSGDKCCISNTIVRDHISKYKNHAYKSKFHSDGSCFKRQQESFSVPQWGSHKIIKTKETISPNRRSTGENALSGLFRYLKEMKKAIRDWTKITAQLAIHFEGRLNLKFQ